MLDLDYVREHPEEVREAAEKKGEDCDIDEVLSIDRQRRERQHELDQKRHRRNEGSEQVGQLKQEGKDEEAEQKIEELSTLSDEIQEGEQELKEIEEALKDRMKWIPNIPDSDVPVGEDESDNEQVKSHGEKPDFDFDPQPHWDLGEELDLIEFQRGAKLSGRGYYALRGQGARLERALIRWMLDLHTDQHGYTEMMVPLLSREQNLYGTGQLPKLERDMYRTEKEGLYAIPTSEVPLMNLHRDEELDEEDLPLKYTAGSACFRREAGAAGRETRGIIRVHQFNKVEIAQIVQPDETEDTLDTMLSHAETVLQKLNLPYRILLLCTGDTTFASEMTYDIEVWAPGCERWLEVSSVSSCSDFQARRCNIRYRDEDGKLQYPHTLNGSGLALPRTMIAILENYQQSDGTVQLPEVLLPYMNGTTFLE